MSEKEKVKPVRPNIRELMRAKMREQQQQSTDGNANAANGDEEVLIMCKPRTTNSNLAVNHEPASDIPVKVLRTDYEVGANGLGSESTPVESAISESSLNVNFNIKSSELPVSKYERSEPTIADSFGYAKQPADDQVDGALSISDFELAETSAEAAMYTATNTSGVSFPRRPQTLTAPTVSVRAQIDKFSPPTTTLNQVSPSVATNQGVLTTGAPPSPTNAIRSSYAAPSAANLTPSPSASSNGTPNANLNSDPQQTANMQNGDYEELLQRARAQAERELATEFAATRREQEATLARLEGENRSLQLQAEQIQHANEELRFVIAAYDEQIAKLEKTRKANVEESKRRLQSVEAQRDQAISEVLSLEKAFSDLHRRLEVSKHCLTQQVERERQQAQQLEEALQRVKRWETKYAQLKQHAEEKLSLANREIEKVRKHSSAELAGLEALVKKLELERTSTSEALARKTAEVDELHKICDELLMKLNQRDIP